MRPLLGAVPLAMAWLFLPGGAGVAAGAVAIVAAGIAAHLDRRRLALGFLAAAAAGSILVSTGPAAWSVWLAAGLFPFALDAVVSSQRDRPEGGFRVSLPLGLALLVAGGILGAWRPAREALTGTGGTLAVALALAGVGVALALLLTGEDEAPA